MKIKNIFLLLSLLCINFSQLIAQNQAPVVENVTFKQRIDDSFIVDIYYDVNDPDGDLMTVTMRVSDDNGATWDFAANEITGDIGSGINNGTNKHVVWDFGEEHSQTFGDQFKVKIIADDGGGTPCPGIPIIVYEGKTYNTVQIESQCWLKENLDVGTRINGIEEMTDNGIIEKYCYNDDPANCNTYGGLYQWNETMQYVTYEGAQGVCPPGWHIPLRDEFLTLYYAVVGDGNALKAVGQGTGGGAGTNTSGFSALLAGHRYQSTGGFVSLGTLASFWSSTEYTPTTASGMYLVYDSNGVWFYGSDKLHGFSVRCLKN